MQGVGPQGKVDRLWPASARMEQLLVCAFQEVLDGLLGDAILEVGIFPTEGELLPSSEVQSKMIFMGHQILSCNVLEEEVPTELKVLLTLSGTLTSLLNTPLRSRPRLP